MSVEYVSRKRGSIKAWIGKLLMPVVSVVLLAGMATGNVWAAGSCDVVKDGLVACYPFDGDAKDYSGNGNDGTVNGATLTTDRFGKPNDAYQFDGNGNFILIPNNLLLNPASLTISAWVRISANAISGMDIVSKDGEGFERQYLLAESADAQLFRAHIGKSDGSFEYFDGKTAVLSESWYHVVQTYDGNLLRMYVNGLEEPSAKIAEGGGVVSSSQPVRIGGGAPDGQPPQWFNGVIDDVRIYNRALTETEIQTLYQLKDSPPKTCEHAVYSVTNNIGKLVIPLVDIPLLNLYTHQPTGELAVFSGELKQVGSSMDFGLVSSKLKLVVLTPAHDPCHALYDETQKTLHAPFVDVGNEVYDVTFQHLKDIPLELGVFHLESYNLVE